MVEAQGDEETDNLYQYKPDYFQSYPFKRKKSVFLTHEGLFNMSVLDER